MECERGVSADAEHDLLARCYGFRVHVVSVAYLEFQ